MRRQSLQGMVLRILARGDALTVQQLAARCGGSGPAVQKAAEVLCRRGELARLERGTYMRAARAAAGGTP